MDANELRELRALVAGLPGRSLADAVAAAKDGATDGERSVTAAMVWAAFSCPDAVLPLYDSLAAAWLDAQPSEDPLPAAEHAPLEAPFWENLQSATLAAHHRTYTPATASARTAALGRHTHPELVRLAEATVRHRMGELIDATPVFDLDPQAWASCPDGSLGGKLATMIAERSYDTTDGEPRELRSLPPALARVQDRAHALHAVWRAAAGYSASESHLVAFAAFQAAQCGHLFSTAALSLFACIAAYVIPNSFQILQHVIAEGWRHGRRTPPLLGVDWRHYWERPLEDMRTDLQVDRYRSIFHPNLFQVLPPHETE